MGREPGDRPEGLLRPFVAHGPFRVTRRERGQAGGARAGLTQSFKDALS